MNLWPSRYVLLGFLAIGAWLVGLLVIFAYWLVTDFYFGAVAAGVGLVVAALTLDAFWVELRYRFRIWNRISR